jgi:hypothetical protein
VDGNEGLAGEVKHAAPCTGEFALDMSDMHARRSEHQDRTNSTSCTVTCALCGRCRHSEQRDDGRSCGKYLTPCHVARAPPLQPDPRQGRAVWQWQIYVPPLAVAVVAAGCCAVAARPVNGRLTTMAVPTFVQSRHYTLFPPSRDSLAGKHAFRCRAGHLRLMKHVYSESCQDSAKQHLHGSLTISALPRASVGVPAAVIDAIYIHYSWTRRSAIHTCTEFGALCSNDNLMWIK